MHSLSFELGTLNLKITLYMK